MTPIELVPHMMIRALWLHLEWASVVPAEPQGGRVGVPSVELENTQMPTFCFRNRVHIQELIRQISMFFVRHAPWFYFPDVLSCFNLSDLVAPESRIMILGSP